MVKRLMQYFNQFLTVESFWNQAIPWHMSDILMGGKINQYQKDTKRISGG